MERKTDSAICTSQVVGYIPDYYQAGSFFTMERFDGRHFAHPGLAVTSNNSNQGRFALFYIVAEQPAQELCCLFFQEQFGNTVDVTHCFIAVEQDNAGLIPVPVREEIRPIACHIIGRTCTLSFIKKGRNC